MLTFFSTAFIASRRVSHSAALLLLLDRYCKYFVTSDNQFGFKRESSCAHAIYTLRSVVDYYVNINVKKLP